MDNELIKYILDNPYNKICEKYKDIKTCINYTDYNPLILKSNDNFYDAINKIINYLFFEIKFGQLYTEKQIKLIKINFIENKIPETKKVIKNVFLKWHEILNIQANNQIYVMNKNKEYKPVIIKKSNKKLAIYKYIDNNDDNFYKSVILNKFFYKKEEEESNLNNIKDNFIECVKYFYGIKYNDYKVKKSKINGNFFNMINVDLLLSDKQIDIKSTNNIRFKIYSEDKNIKILKSKLIIYNESDNYYIYSIANNNETIYQFVL